MQVKRGCADHWLRELWVKDSVKLNKESCNAMIGNIYYLSVISIPMGEPSYIQNNYTFVSRAMMFIEILPSHIG